MDLTKEGHQQHTNQHNYYGGGGGSNQGPSYGWNVNPNPNYSRWQQVTNIASDLQPGCTGLNTG